MVCLRMSAATVMYRLSSINDVWCYRSSVARSISISLLTDCALEQQPNSEGVVQQLKSPIIH